MEHYISIYNETVSVPSLFTVNWVARFIAADLVYYYGRGGKGAYARMYYIVT